MSAPADNNAIQYDRQSTLADEETAAKGHLTTESMSESKPVQFDFPDGGTRAWIIVAGAWCISACTWGYANAFGVYQDYYKTHQLSDYTASDISWIGSLQILFLSGSGFFVGRIFDAGYLKYLNLVGSIVLVLGVMMVSISTKYAHFILAHGVTCGLGYGLLFIPSMGTIAHWFKRKRSLAVGIAASGSSIGGIIFPILLNQCFTDPSVGFPWGVRAAGFLILGLLIFANLTMAQRLPARKEGAMIDFTVFKDTPYTLFIAGSFMGMLGLYLPFFYSPSYITYNGMSQNLSFYSLTILNAASFFGRTLTNYAADFWGPLNILIPCLFVSGILIFAWIGATNPGGMITFLILFGFFSGAYVSAMPACIAELTPIPNHIGVRLGMGFMITSVAGLTGTPIMGAIIKQQGGEYWSAAAAAGLFCCTGSFLMAAGRRLHSKRKGDWRC